MYLLVAKSTYFVNHFAAPVFSLRLHDFPKITLNCKHGVDQILFK